MIRHTFVDLPGRPFVTLDLTEEAGDVTVDWTKAPATYLVCAKPDVAGAVVRVRYSCTPEQARAINQAAIRRALLDAGAHVVRIEPPTIQRTDRGRLDEILDQVWDDASETRQPSAAGLSPMEAIEAWIVAQDLDDDTASALRIRTAGWLDAATTRAPEEAAA